MIFNAVEILHTYKAHPDLLIARISHDLRGHRWAPQGSWRGDCSEDGLDGFAVIIYSFLNTDASTKSIFYLRCHFV